MLKRYFEIYPFPDQNDPDLVPILLSPAQHNSMAQLLAKLTKFDSVSDRLQKEDLSMLQARKLFDSIVVKFGGEYPTLKTYLSPTGRAYDTFRYTHQKGCFATDNCAFHKNFQKSHREP